MKKFFIYALLFTNLLLPITYAQHSYDSYKFDNQEQAELFYTITQETRCIVCQGQNVADSNAALAIDLRKKIYSMIKENKTQQEINSYLVKRYGDFILLEPPIKITTLFLWLFPLIMLISALYFLFKFFKPRPNEAYKLD